MAHIHAGTRRVRACIDNPPSQALLVNDMHDGDMKDVTVEAHPHAGVPMWNVSAPSLTWSVWRASTSTYPASRRRPLVPLDAKVWTRTPKSQEGRRQGRASVHRPQDAPSRLDADELIRLAEQQPNHSHYFDQAVRYTRIVAMPMSGGTLDFEELHVYSHVTTCRESFDENPSNPSQDTRLKSTARIAVRILSARRLSSRTSHARHARCAHPRQHS